MYFLMCNLVCDVAFVVEYVLCMCGLGRHVVPAEQRSPQKDCDTAESGRVVRAPHMLEEK